MSSAECDLSQLTSIIVVGRDAGPENDQALASFLAQTAPIEVVWVDDGCSAATNAAWESKAKADPRIKIVQGHGRVGLGEARNLGTKAAVGQHLLFVEANAVIPVDAVARLTTLSAKLKPPFLLGGKVVDDKKRECPDSRRALLSPLVSFVSTLGLSSSFPKYRASLTNDPLPAKTTQVPAISGAFMFTNRATFDLLRGYVGAYHDDFASLDFCLRLTRAEGRVYFVPGLTIQQLRLLREPLDFEEIKLRLRGHSAYFYENFSHAYPQPALWLLDVLTWIPAIVPYISSRWKSSAAR